MQLIASATGASFQVESNAQPAARPVVVDTVNSAPPVAAAAAGAQPTQAEVEKAVATANNALKQADSDREFAVDTSTGKTIVRIVDSSTRQVIRQFPSEETLAITRTIDHFQGLLLKEKA